MNSSLPESYCKDEYKNYNKIKLENERLNNQNKKLITKMEQITCEFSKSQCKIKHLEMQNNSTTTNGNLESILARNKSLEHDNKQLCQAIKLQLDSTHVFETPVNKITMENNSNNCKKAETIKSASDEKNTHLNDQIQELRKQLLKTQQLAYKSECNHKISQIETLEALKSCKLENDSLMEKNLELENKVKNIINLHSENLEMKTILYRSQNDLNVLKSDFDNLKLKQTESTKIFDHEKKSFEKQVLAVQKKNEDLLNENQILLSTIDELTKSEIANKSVKCSECAKYSNKLAESDKQIRMFESQLQQLQESKLKAENEFLSQTETFKHFEEEQLKLKEEIKHLNGVKLSFDASMKLKVNEIDNLTSQFESCSQRLELREQRINELTNQLSLKVTEERNLKSRISKVTEKLNFSQDEVKKYVNDLSEIQREKDRLMENLKNLQQAMTEKLLLVDQLSIKLKETLSANNQLEESLQFHVSSSETKLREYTNNINDLKEKVDELNYSINIYENHNRRLESELKETRLKLESSINNEIKIVESHQIEITRYQVHLTKNQELIEDCHNEIKDKDCKICEIESLKNELHFKLLEKSNENEYLSKTSKEITEELSIAKKQLLSFGEQMKLHLSNTETIQNLRLKLSKRSDKILLQENAITELNEKVDVLNRDLINQKQISESLQLKLSKVEKCLEKLRVKASWSQETLEQKLKGLNSVIEHSQIEHQQLFEKFNSLVKERDDLLRKMKENEELVLRLESEINRHKNELSYAQQINGALKDDVIVKEKTINKLEKKILTLHDYLKCSQLNVVDKSREIDRLEQLVRDRSEQIELRSNQLQDFEIDLEQRLIESRKQIENTKEQEAVAKAELDNMKLKFQEFSSALDMANQDNCKLKDALKKKEQAYNSVFEQLKKLESENKITINKMKSLINDSEMNATTINGLRSTIIINENKRDKLVDEMRSKSAKFKGKCLQIRQLEDQIKKDKTNSIQIEAELQTQIKLLTRKLNSFSSEKKKEMENLLQNLSNQHQDQLTELASSKKRSERLSADLDEMNIKLFEKEEHISELKAQINTQSMVMADMESNHRLKEAVIERLMQKIDDLTLTDWPNELNDKISNKGEIKSNEKSVEDLQTRTNHIYEDVTLEDLLTRLNIRLNSDNKII